MVVTRRTLLASTGAAAMAVVLDVTRFSVGRVFAAEPEGRRVTLLHFTDTHAMLETHPEYLPGASPEIRDMGGFARLKTALDRERAASDGPCFVFDGGDEFQGSGPAAWSQGEVVLRPLDALGADVFTPGNWEPAYGPKIFKETMARLACPVACYNLHDTTSGERIFAPSVLLERQGVKIAVVGVTDIGASKRQPPAEFEGMDTTRIEGLRDFLKDLRARENPDLVVWLSHTGLSIARQMARETPELDVILSGHTHERTAEPILQRDVIVVEPGCFGSFVGRLDIVLKPGGGVAHHKYRLIPVLASEYPEDPAVKALVDTELQPYRARMAEHAGTTETLLMRYDLFETTADDFIADAVREASGADIGFTNGFRFGAPVPPRALTVGDLWNLLPMDARMKSGWVTGKELKDYLENELDMVYASDPWKLNGGWGPRASGMAFTFRARAPKGERIVSMTVNGEAVADDRRYTIGGCEREGEPLDVICRHAGSHDAKVIPGSVHEALLAYLEAHPTVAPHLDGRERAMDLPARAFSQDAVLAGGDLLKAPTTPNGMPG